MALKHRQQENIGLWTFPFVFIARPDCREYFSDVKCPYAEYKYVFILYVFAYLVRKLFFA